MDHILLQRENKTPTVAVFLDLSKAFDTISHAGLITKLELYGIKGHELKLIKNYVSRRVQQTSLNGTPYIPKKSTSESPRDLSWDLHFSYCLSIIYLKSLSTVRFVFLLMTLL